MKILVTGGTGYIGSYLLGKLLRGGTHSVTALSRKKHALFSGREGFREIIGDPIATDEIKGQVLSFGPDAIFHLAAQSSPARCEQDPELATASNLALSRFVSSLAQESGAFICFASTDWVFDGAGPPPLGGFTELQAARPLAVYSRLKHEAEIIFSEQPSAILRLCLTYGPRLPNTNNLFAWVEDGLRGEKQFNLFTDEWRTPVYVGDVAQAFIDLANTRLEGIFHVAGPERLSRHQYGHQVADILGIPPERVSAGVRADLKDSLPRPEDLSLNSAKLERAFDFEFLPIREGLRRAHEFSGNF